MCLVLVKSNVGIKKKFFFSKIATKKDFFLHSNEKNKINLLNTEIFFFAVIPTFDLQFLQIQKFVK